VCRATGPNFAGYSVYRNLVVQISTEDPGAVGFVPVAIAIVDAQLRRVPESLPYVVGEAEQDMYGLRVPWGNLHRVPFVTWRSVGVGLELCCQFHARNRNRRF
jgi:hypothetical protein